MSDINLINKILRLINDENTPSVQGIKDSGWLSDELSTSDLEVIYQEYSKEFSRYLEEFTIEFGKPNKTLSQDRDWIDNWYPEAFELAAWKIDENYLYLAASHHERETPVVLEVGIISERDME